MPKKTVGDVGAAIRTFAIGTRPSWSWPVRKWVSWDSDIPAMATARIALAFGMEVYACTSKSPLQLGTDIRKSTMEELFSACDVISLNCPLTPETHHLVNPHTLALMKPGAILINTGRGPLVDEEAVAEALENNTLAGYGADVQQDRTAFGRSSPAFGPERPSHAAYRLGHTGSPPETHGHLRTKHPRIP